MRTSEMTKEVLRRWPDALASVGEDGTWCVSYTLKFGPAYRLTTRFVIMITRGHETEAQALAAALERE